MRSQVDNLEAQQRDLQAQDAAVRRELAEQKSKVSAMPPEAVSPKNAVAPIASLVLLPGLSRAAARTELLVLIPSAQVAHIEIQLEPRDAFRRFRAELRTRAGEDVLTRGNLARQLGKSGSVVAFDVPASALQAGNYELALKGIGPDQSITDVGYYYFSVRRP
jgi:hypothetical protein